MFNLSEFEIYSNRSFRHLVRSFSRFRPAIDYILAHRRRIVVGFVEDGCIYWQDREFWDSYSPYWHCVDFFGKEIF